MKKVTLSFLLCLLMTFSANVMAQNLSETINQQLTKLLDNDNLLAQDMYWEITNDQTSRVSGVHHIYYRQLVNGIHVYGTESGVHLLSNGKVLAADNKFINKTADKLKGSATPSLTAIEAVQSAANQLNYTITETLSVLTSENSSSQKSLLSDGGISLSPIPAKLMYQLTEANELVLVWDISIQ